MFGRFSLFLVLTCWLAVVGSAAADVRVLDIDGPIGPATASYVVDGIEQAPPDTALLVLRVDTPGGLDSAMRQIIRAILASDVPVATYVAPGGARAASAGTYILYASHIAAMAPGTNLGAATPVRLGGLPSSPSPGDGGGGGDGGDSDSGGNAGGGSAMEHKMVNDAVAYIRSLAELRGRNADWAEKAVREAASLPASTALDKGVIDLMANDVDDLLAQVDGRKVTTAAGERTLATAGAAVQEVEPGWRTELLAVLTNPNVAYILMLVGVYGLIFELANPGAVVPGVLGGICLLLALFAFQALPINYAGLGLILLGVAFMIAEAFVPSFGALGLGGVAAFAIGSVMLFDTQTAGFQLSLMLVAGFTLASLIVFLGTATLALRAHGRPVVSGRQQMLGSEGVAVADFTGKGKVRIHGELWQAEATEPVRAGQRVRVTGMEGLKLTVVPVAEESIGHADA